MIGKSLAHLVAACCVSAAPAASAAAIPRIYNGTPLGAAPPWMGFVRTQAAGGISGCGGVAISRNVVLTAAHCVVDEARNAYVNPAGVGVAFRQSDPWGALRAGTLAVDRVVRYYTPSMYGRLVSGGSVNDVALLRLRAPAPGVVALLPSIPARSLGAGRPALVLGWGQTGDGSLPHALRDGALTIQSHKLCSRRFEGYDRNTMLCARGNSNQSTCHGDSGGPLLVADAARTIYAAGVVASGDAGCDPSSPSVFSNVATGPLAAFVSRYARKLQTGR